MGEDNLKYIYDDIYRWLVFAEAKNLAMITICLVIIDNVLSDGLDLNSKWFSTKLCIVIILGLACIMFIVSMIPFLNNNRFVKSCAQKRYNKYRLSSNIIFYGSIFYKHIEGTYKNNIERCYDSNRVLSKFEKDIIQQIEEISTVTLIKIWFFDLTIKFLLLGVIVFITVVIICA